MFGSSHLILSHPHVTQPEYCLSANVIEPAFTHSQMLLLHCDKLSSIKHLTAFKMIHPMELAMLRAELKSGNLEVDTGEEDEARIERVREGLRFSESVSHAITEL